MRERVVRSGVLLLGGVLLGACLVAAGRAFFSEDDFRWLATVRAPDFDLLDAWLPYAERDWWSYRPLAMHTWWWTGQAVFGLWPAGFYAVALCVHFGRGLLVHRLARQLGWSAEVAAVTAWLAVSRPPSLDVVFWASAFSYFAVSFLMLLAVVWLNAGLASGARRWQVGSCLATVMALFCQEAALLLPAILFGVALHWELRREASARGASAGSGAAGGQGAGRRAVGRVLVRALVHVLPQAGLTVLFAVHRFVLIAPFPRQQNYQPLWGWNTARNAWRYVEWICGGSAGAWLAALIVLSGLVWLVWRQWRAAEGLAAVLGGAALAPLLAIWLGAGLLPFVAVARSAPRFAIAAEVPLALVAGAVCAGVWSRLAERQRTWLAAALLLLALAAMPWATLRTNVALPRGAHAEHVLRAIEAFEPEPAAGRHFVVLYGEPGLVASAHTYHRESWSGTPMMESRWPGRGVSLVFRRPGDRMPAIDFAPEARHLVLHAERGLEPASAEARERFFRRGLGSTAPGARAAAAASLARLRGPAARGPEAAELPPAPR